MVQILPQYLFFHVDKNYNSWYNHAIVVETQENRKIILDPIKGLLFDGVPIDPNEPWSGGGGTGGDLFYWVKPNAAEFNTAGMVGFAFPGTSLDSQNFTSLGDILKREPMPIP